MRLLAPVLTFTLLLFPTLIHAQESAFPTPGAARVVVEELDTKSQLEKLLDDGEQVLEEPEEAPELRGKVAQLMLVTLQGQQNPSSEDMNLLRNYTPGGVILKQVVRPTDALTYVAAVRSAEAVNGIPMWVGTDLYELTKTARAAEAAYLPLPSLLSLAATQDLDAAKELGQLFAVHASSLGLNLHMGPSLCLAPELQGAPGSIHCLGSNPAFAAQAGAILMQAFEEVGILAAPTGFPGGANDHLSDGMAILSTPAETLPDADLLPYRKAIVDGAKVIHVANTLTPTLTANSTAASQSPTVMRTLLRETLGFDGVIIAGPLDAPELLSTGADPTETVQQALLSGADMAYLRGPDSMVKRVVDRTVAAVEAGVIPESVIDAAYERVTGLKKEWSERWPQAVKQTKIDRMSKDKDMRKTLAQIERQAVTLVKNNNFILPLEEKTPIGVTGVVGTDIVKASLKRFSKHVSEQPISTARHLGEIQDFEILRLTDRPRGMPYTICILTDSLRPGGQVRLLEAFKAQGTKLILILLGYPRYLDQLDMADAIILAYGDPDSYNVSIAAATDLIMGHSAVGLLDYDMPLELQVDEERSFNLLDVVRAPMGRLPVDVSEQFPLGLGHTYDPRTSIKKAEWDFGDGKKRSSKDHEPVVYAYKKPGTYTITLTIEESRKAEQSQQYQVVVSE